MGNSDSYSNFFKYFGFKAKEYRVLILGLDAAGKTTILYNMKLGEVVTTIPTIGFNVETLKHKNVQMTVWDVGGRDKMRVLFRHYFANTDAFVYVVDSNDRERMNEAKEEMHRFLSEDELRDCILLVLANKQDLSGAMSVKEVNESLKLDEIKNRKINIFGVTATQNKGLNEAFDWLSKSLKEPNGKEVSTIIEPLKETINDVKNITEKVSTTQNLNSWFAYFSKLSYKVISITN